MRRTPVIRDRRGQTGGDVRMAEITLIVGSAVLFVTGFVAWYTIWHRRVESCFEKVPVATGRSAHVLRRGADLDGDDA